MKNSTFSNPPPKKEPEDDRTQAKRPLLDEDLSDYLVTWEQDEFFEMVNRELEAESEEETKK